MAQNPVRKFLVVAAMLLTFADAGAAFAMPIAPIADSSALSATLVRGGRGGGARGVSTAAGREAAPLQFAAVAVARLRCVAAGSIEAAPLRFVAAPFVAARLFAAAAIVVAAPWFGVVRLIVGLWAARSRQARPLVSSRRPALRPISPASRRRPGLCWYYTDSSRRAGFWDNCP